MKGYGRLRGTKARTLLLGPLLTAATHPLHLVESVRLHPDFYRLWLEDLRYYRACDFFDGRKGPDRARLARFA